MMAAACPGVQTTLATGVTAESAVGAAAAAAVPVPAAAAEAIVHTAGQQTARTRALTDSPVDYHQLAAAKADKRHQQAQQPLDQEEAKHAHFDHPLPPLPPSVAPAAPVALAHSFFDEVGDEDCSDEDDEEEELAQVAAEAASSAAVAIVVSDDVASSSPFGPVGLSGPVGRGCFCADPTRLNNDILCSHHSQAGSRCYATHIHCLQKAAGARYDAFILGTSSFLCRACVNLPQFTPPDSRFFECVVESAYGHVYNPVHRTAAPHASSSAVAATAALEAALKDSIRESMRSAAADVASASASVSALAGSAASSAMASSSSAELREFTPSELLAFQRSAALKLLAGGGTSAHTLADVQIISSSSSASPSPSAAASFSTGPRASSPERPLSPPFWLYFYPVCAPWTLRTVRICINGEETSCTTQVCVKQLQAQGRGKRRKVPARTTQKEEPSAEAAASAQAQAPASSKNALARPSKKRPLLDREEVSSPEKPRTLHVVVRSSSSSASSSAPLPPVQRSGTACWCRCDCAPCRTLHADAQTARHGFSSVASQSSDGSVSDFLSALCSGSSFSAAAAAASAFASSSLSLPSSLLDPLRRLLEPAALSMAEVRRMPHGLVRQIMLAAFHESGKDEQLSLPDIDTLVHIFSAARFKLAASPAHFTTAAASHAGAFVIE